MAKVIEVEMIGTEELKLLLLISPFGDRSSGRTDRTYPANSAVIVISIFDEMNMIKSAHQHNESYANSLA